MTKKIKYTEPVDYFPKEIREKYFGKNTTAKASKKSASKGKSTKK